MELEQIRQFVREDRYDYSNHAQEATDEREISDAQVKDVVLQGKVLEIYIDDVRGKSYLVLGKGPLHVLVGYNKYRDRAVIITVYVPEFPKWIASDKRGESK